MYNFFKKAEIFNIGIKTKWYSSKRQGVHYIMEEQFLFQGKNGGAKI